MGGKGNTLDKISIKYNSNRSNNSNIVISPSYLQHLFLLILTFYFSIIPIASRPYSMNKL